MIGAQAVLSAPPDGHTLLYAASTLLFTVLPAVKDKLPFDVNRDFIPIGLTAVDGIALRWSVLLAPSGTLPAVVQQLGEDLREVLDDPDVRGRFEKIGGTPFRAIYTADAVRFIESEQKLWWPIVTEAEPTIEPSPVSQLATQVGCLIKFSSELYTPSGR